LRESNNRWIGWRSLLASDADVAFSAERLALLAGSERRYRLLAEAMPQMIWMADPLGEVNYWNRAWYRYTGTAFVQSNPWP
jgi:PAS domain-containing protein